MQAGATNAVRAAVLATAVAVAPINVVWFAGGGGSSEGFVQAGLTVDYALNHNATALAMHAVNHPDTTHLCEDARAPDPRTLAPGRRVGVFWASPDCKHFSKARGRAPVSDRIRGLAWCVIPWAKLRRPDVIIIENVEEFVTYGPIDASGKPIVAHRGRTFRRFIRRLEQSGYVVEWRELVAADYGAPTTRKRFYLVARCDGLPIRWPERTHAPRHQAAKLGLQVWRSASECLDFNLPCPSIFLTPAEARAAGCKRPLVAATHSRIARGLERYVIGAAEPFILPITHYGDRRVHAVGDPVRTVTAANRGELALASAYLGRQFGSTVSGRPLDAPAPTVMGDGAGGKSHLVSAVLTPRYGEREGQAPRVRDVVEPYPTVVPDGNGGQVTAAYMVRTDMQSAATRNGVHQVEDPLRTVTSAGGFAATAVSLGRQFGRSVGSGADAPLGAVMAGGGGKTQLIAVNLGSYYGTGTGSSAEEPMRTVTGEDRHAVTAAWLEQANTGMTGHDARDPLSTIVGRGTTQRLAEVRLARIGAAPGTRRRQVLEFLWAHFGAPEEADWADPAGTLQARLRFGLVLIRGEAWEIVDIGLRMLTVRELFNAQGFRSDYIIDRDARGRKITGTAATLMVGNSVCPPVAAAICKANIPRSLRPPERMAA